MKKILRLYLLIISIIASQFLMAFTNQNLHYVFANNDRYSEYGTVSQVRELYDLQNHLRYNYVEFDNGGYMIYDLYLNDYIEYSAADNSSPYLGVQGKIYYNGLLKYYHEISNEIIDIMTNNVFDYNNSDNIINNYNMYVNMSVKNATANLELSHFEVSYSKYFKNLDGIINKFPKNTENDCGYVAASILLGYYANFYDANLACEHYMNEVNSNTVDDLYKYVTCFTQDFKDKILKQSGDPNATMPTDIYKSVNRYIENTPAKDNFACKSFMPTHSSAINNLVKSNKPVLVFGRFEDLNTGARTGNHVILVYGISKNNKFIAHLGHTKKSYVELDSTVLFNFNGGFFYLEYLGDCHNHTSYYKLNGNHYCIICGEYIEPILQKKYISKINLGHKIICTVCLKEKFEGHSYTVLGINKKTCIYCGFVEFMKPGELIEKEMLMRKLTKMHMFSI